MRKFFYSTLFVFCSLFATAQQTIAEIVIGSPEHETLEAAVIAADLAGVLSAPGNFTVFAPTDAAFAALPAGTVDALLQDPKGDLAKILKYHVVGAEVFSTDLTDGQSAMTLLGQSVTVQKSMSVRINNALVTVADIDASNGVVHVIDAVLLPATTVADVVINSPDHETLEAAVVAAGLAPALQGDGPFTVFAPTDAAFAALPGGTVDALLQDPTGDLAKILMYHVIGGETMAADLSDGMMGRTLLGQGVNFEINADGAFINGAKISVTDIQTLNGVVHVLDAVILPPSANVADVVVNSPMHETLEAAVTAAGLVPALQGDGPFTVFAPTDAAFAALPMGTVDALLQDPTGDLAKILMYHVVGGETLAGDLSDGMMAQTLLGQGVNFEINADGAFINGAKITMTDIRTFNGVVHVIDAVILPAATVADVVVNSPVHETLEAAVTAAGLVPALQGDGDLTVFAPTDAAFAALPAGTVDALLQDPTGDLAKILLYHVVGGETLAGDLSDGMTARSLLGQGVDFRIDADGAFINDAKISVTDIRTLNGVVHVIDAVILPPAANVAEVVINSSVHETLEAAVIAAELAGALSGDGPFTVFAPTDDAFAALPAGTVDALLQDPTGDLAKILQYHVVSGEVLSNDLSDGQSATTLLGQDVNVRIDADGIFVNDAKVIMSDIRTFNGVVHVIDAVILPNLSSVGDLEEVPVTIAPNPTTDFVTVDLPEKMLSEEAIIRIVSMEGKVLKTLQTAGTQTTVDVNDLATGTYILLLTSDTAAAKATIIVK